MLTAAPSANAPLPDPSASRDRPGDPGAGLGMLSQLGADHMVRFAASPVLGARDGHLQQRRTQSGRYRAHPLRAKGNTLQRGGSLHENDRSATGYLPPNQFEAMADRFFAEPQASVLGWERAVDAQGSNCWMHPRNLGAGHEAWVT